MGIYGYYSSRFLELQRQLRIPVSLQIPSDEFQEVNRVAGIATPLLDRRVA